MDIKPLASRVGIFGVLPDRKTATNTMLKKWRRGKGLFKDLPTAYYVDDNGLRIVSPVGKTRNTLTRVTEGMVPHDLGFNPRAKKGIGICYGNMLITKHALHRWHQRGSCNFPKPEEMDRVAESITRKEMLQQLTTHKGDKPFTAFYPFGEGAFIIDVKPHSLYTLAHFCQYIDVARKTCVTANWQWDKRTKTHYAEYLPRGLDSIVKTYLGWEELRKGGTYNSIDWYKEGFEWQELDGKWRQTLKDMGIDLG
jgi:hypothetical protein